MTPREGGSGILKRIETGGMNKAKQVKGNDSKEASEATK
jgi:hypothetical protein